jgi:tetratricopeptide (TPR) repeat protein
VGQRARGHIALAIFEASRGRWNEAKTDLAAAELLYPAAALQFGSILSLAPYLEVPQEDLDYYRDKLSQWNPGREKPKEDFPYPPGLHPLLRPYLLGLLSAHLGEEASAMQYASELDGLPAPELLSSMPEDLAGSVRAHVALNKGGVEDALSLLEQARMDVHASRNFFYAPYVFVQLTHERFLRAELLHRLGRDEEALGWYNSDWAYGGASFAFAHLRIAEIREKQGDIKRAVEYYDRFTRFWKDCAPELRPLVEDAKESLEGLRKADSG